MNSSFTDEQEEFRQEIADFCKAEVQDRIARPSSSPSFIQKVAQKGWLGLSIPDEYGGLGRDAIYRVIFNEEIA
jgi:alkylation response protein AidB-like acyl-CoA dehydrogenase